MCAISASQRWVKAMPANHEPRKWPLKEQMVHDIRQALGNPNSAGNRSPTKLLKRAPAAQGCRRKWLSGDQYSPDNLAACGTSDCSKNTTALVRAVRGISNYTRGRSGRRVRMPDPVIELQLSRASMH
jgi:hypothetical protein